MLDFTSALYLGFEHPSRSLPVWTQFTLGKPAALEQLPGVPEVERQLAALVGCERVLLGPSTFHLFWDLFRWLIAPRTEIFVAAGSYPIAQWGVHGVTPAGVPVRTFRRDQWPACDRWGSRPVIVTDGFFPADGHAAPLREYVSLVQKHDGFLVIDDTQALGIFGSDARPSRPFGSGGGGSLRAGNIPCGRVIVVSSLAKALGVPVAMIGGGRETIEQFEAASATRVHCSPPSAPAVAAALRALEMNERYGENARFRLARRVRAFRAGLARLGLGTTAGMFPVQPVGLPDGVGAEDVHEQLLRRGVKAVLHAGGKRRGGALLSFVITARHRPSEIDEALTTLADALKLAPREISRGPFHRQRAWSRGTGRGG